MGWSKGYSRDGGSMGVDGRRNGREGFTKETMPNGVLGLVIVPQVEEYREREGRKGDFCQWLQHKQTHEGLSYLTVWG